MATLIHICLSLGALMGFVCRFCGRSMMAMSLFTLRPGSPETRQVCFTDGCELTLGERTGLYHFLLLMLSVLSIKILIVLLPRLSFLSLSTSICITAISTESLTLLKFHFIFLANSSHLQLPSKLIHQKSLWAPPFISGHAAIAATRG